jgi:hypothetical protein
MDERDIKKINDIMRQLLTEEDDDERRLYLAGVLLEADPDNAVGKYVKWQSSTDLDSLKDTSLLEEAIASVRPGVESDGGEEAGRFFASMLSDLASFSYIAGDKDKAFRAAEEFMKYDRDGGEAGRMIYYAVLVERGDFEAVLRTADEDYCESPQSEYCRAIAAFELDGRDETSAGYLLDAMDMDPDLPFYILGLWELDDEFDDAEPGESEEYVEEMMMSVAVLSELWAANEERLAFLSIFAFAFGYITGRLDGPEELAMIEDSYRELGCLYEIQEARDIIHAMLASGADQSETDEKALALFLENDYYGMME